MYMSQWNIQAIAEVALTSYEESNCWDTAIEAIQNFSQEEFCCEATQAQVIEAVNIAKDGWAGVYNCVEQVTYSVGP